MKIIIVYFLFFYLKAIFLIVRIAVRVLSKENDPLVQTIRKMNADVDSIALWRLLFPSWAKLSASIFDVIPEPSVGLHQFTLWRTQDIFFKLKLDKVVKIMMEFK